MLESSFPIKTLQELLNDFNCLVLASTFPSSLGCFSTLHLHSSLQKMWIISANSMIVMKRKRLTRSERTHCWSFVWWEGCRSEDPENPGTCVALVSGWFEVRFMGTSLGTACSLTVITAGVEGDLFLAQDYPTIQTYLTLQRPGVSRACGMFKKKKQQLYTLTKASKQINKKQKKEIAQELSFRRS